MKYVMPFSSIQLPYKPLDPSIMVPIEWLKQKHINCEDVDNNIKHPHEDPASVIVDMGMENQEKEWYGIVSELYQGSRNKNRSTSQEINQYPYFLLKFC